MGSGLVKGRAVTRGPSGHRMTQANVVQIGHDSCVFGEKSKHAQVVSCLLQRLH